MRIAALGRISATRHGSSSALGRLSSAEVANANAQVEQIANELVALNTRVRAAEREGFSRDLTTELRMDYTAFNARWQALSNELGVLSASNLADWMSRADLLRSEIRRAEVRAQERMAAEAPLRTTGIALKTVFVVGGTILAVWAAWRYSEKFRRFRYGAGRRYGTRKGQRRRV